MAIKALKVVSAEDGESQADIQKQIDALDGVDGDDATKKRRALYDQIEKLKGKETAAKLPPGVFQKILDNVLQALRSLGIKRGPDSYLDNPTQYDKDDGKHYINLMWGGKADIDSLAAKCKAAGFKIELIKAFGSSNAPAVKCFALKGDIYVELFSSSEQNIIRMAMLKNPTPAEKKALNDRNRKRDKKEQIRDDRQPGPTRTL